MDKRVRFAKPGPGRLVRVRDADPTYGSWPEWEHPLGGWGRWAVVIRSLRSGVEAAPLVLGYTLPPRPLRAWQTLEDHRVEAHGRYESLVRSREIARSSGLYTAEQTGEPPVYREALGLRAGENRKEWEREVRVGQAIEGLSKDLPRLDEAERLEALQRLAALLRTVAGDEEAL